MKNLSYCNDLTLYCLFNFSVKNQLKSFILTEDQILIMIFLLSSGILINLTFDIKG